MKKLLLILILGILSINLSSALSFTNASDGFSTAGLTATNVEGIGANSTNILIADRTDSFMYITDLAGTNQSSGFDFTAITGGNFPSGVVTNGTDIWYVDNTDDWVYHIDSAGNNASDGFNTTASGCANPTGLAYNGSDFWITDIDDNAVYHYESNGINSSYGGFDVVGASGLRDIAILDNSLWIQNDVFIYHYSVQGVNQTDGFDSNTLTGGANPTGLATDGTDLYMFDNADNFVYHLQASGTLTVSLDLPANNSKNHTTQINFSATLTPSNANNTNATFYVWYSNDSVQLNKTTVDVIGEEDDVNTTSLNITGFMRGVTYLWNVYACAEDTNGEVCSWGSTGNYTLEYTSFTDTSTTFNNSVLETTAQNYILQIDGIADISSASAVMWYNETSYTSTVTDLTAGNYKATNSMDVPISEVNSANKTFWWEWTFVISGDTVKENSTTRQQEVNRTYLSICNETFTVPFINITTKNATNPYPQLNISFKSSWQWFIGSGSVVRNYSYEDTLETNSTFGICMSDSNTTYQITSTIEVDATDSAKNFHYLTNASITNITTNISLYLLDDSLATLTEFEVTDEAQSPIENVYISIQYYDIGTDTFYTVGMMKTSSEGKDLAYLNWYDSLYKFILVQEGTTIKTSTPYKISETPQTFEIVTEEEYIFEKFEGFEYNLYFNSSTDNFVATFVKPSGDIQAGCLRVIKRNQTQDYLLCKSCEESSSATLYCNVGSYGNGTYIATFYALGSEKTYGSLIEIIEGNILYNLIGNADGTVMAIIFSGVIMVFFFVSPVLGVLGLILGMLGGIVLGFQPVDWMAFTGLVLIGGLVIWLLKR